MNLVTGEIMDWSEPYMRVAPALKAAEDALRHGDKWSGYKSFCEAIAALHDAKRALEAERGLSGRG